MGVGTLEPADLEKWRAVQALLPEVFSCFAEICNTKYQKIKVELSFYFLSVGSKIGGIFMHMRKSNTKTILS